MCHTPPQQKLLCVLFHADLLLSLLHTFSMSHSYLVTFSPRNLMTMCEVSVWGAWVWVWVWVWVGGGICLCLCVWQSFLFLYQQNVHKYVQMIFKLIYTVMLCIFRICFSESVSVFISVRIDLPWKGINLTSIIFMQLFINVDQKLVMMKLQRKRNCNWLNMTDKKKRAHPRPLQQDSWAALQWQRLHI